MFFPEGLYTLSARDRQVTWLEPFLLRETVNVVPPDLGVEFNFSPPAGRLLMLTWAGVRVIAGGAGTIVDAPNSGLDVRPSPGQSGRSMFLALGSSSPGTELSAGGANLVHLITWRGRLIVPPTWQLHFAGFYSVSNAGSRIEPFAFGMLIPVGNVQQI